MKKTVIVELSQEEKINSLIKVANKIEKRLFLNSLSTVRKNCVYDKEKKIIVNYLDSTTKEHNIKIQVVKLELNINDELLNLLKENNFTCYAKLEHNNGIENRIKVFNEKIFDYYTLEQLKELEANCDHCNTNRYRKITYLLFDKKKNKIMQIARTCLKHYTMLENIEKILDYMEVMTEIGYACENDFIEKMDAYSWNNYIKVNNYYEKIKVLSLAKKIVNKYGYISRANAIEGYATIDMVKEKYNSDIKVDESIYNDIKEYLAYDKKKYTKNYRKDDDCFTFTLEKLLTYDYISSSDIGILCYFFNSLESIRKKVQVENEIKEKMQDNNNIELKEKTRVELKGIVLVSDRTYSSDYYYGSTTTYYYFKDNNRTYLWKSSNIIEGLEVGKIVNIKGTVKSIEADKIILTRCKLI